MIYKVKKQEEKKGHFFLSNESLFFMGMGRSLNLVFKFEALEA